MDQKLSSAELRELTIRLLKSEEKLRLSEEIQKKMVLHIFFFVF